MISGAVVFKLHEEEGHILYNICTSKTERCQQLLVLVVVLRLILYVGRCAVDGVFGPGFRCGLGGWMAQWAKSVVSCCVVRLTSLLFIVATHRQGYKLTANVKFHFSSFPSVLPSEEHTYLLFYSKRCPRLIAARSMSGRLPHGHDHRARRTCRDRQDSGLPDASGPSMSAIETRWPRRGCWGGVFRYGAQGAQRGWT